MTSKLGMVWQQAGNDLGIRVSVPFEITTASGLSIFFEVAVHEFGSSQGMLLMERWDAAKAKAAKECGYGYSCMGTSTYDRQSTIEVLQDWGWASSAPQPSWLVQPALQADAP